MSYNPRPTNIFGAAFTRPNSSPSSTVLRVPNGYDSSRPYPLGICFHQLGSGSPPAPPIPGDPGIDVLTRLKLLAAPQFDDGMLMLAPDGQIDPGTGNAFWNFWQLGAQQDFAYVENLILSVIATYNVDLSKIFVMGYSNGAFMAHQLCLVFPTMFTSKFTLAGSGGVNDSMALAVRTIPAVNYHGLIDDTVLYAGSPTGSLPGVLNGHGGVGSVGYKSAPDTAAGNNARNGGSGTLQAPYDTIDFVTTPLGAETERQAYSGTNSHTAVELWTGTGLSGHTITLVDHGGQLMISWMQDHHYTASATVAVNQGSSWLRYLISLDGDNFVEITTTGGLSPDLLTDSIGNGVIKRLAKTFSDGYGQFAAGAQTQAKSRALWLADKLATSPGPFLPIARCRLSRRSNLTGAWFVDADVDGAGNPKIVVTLEGALGIAEAYLDVEFTPVIG